MPNVRAKLTLQISPVSKDRVRVRAVLSSPLGEECCGDEEAPLAALPQVTQYILSALSKIDGIESVELDRETKARVVATSLNAPLDDILALSDEILDWSFSGLLDKH